MTSARRSAELARIRTLDTRKPPTGVTLLTPRQVAAALKIDEKTLSEWRYRNLHLRYCKIGNNVRYRVDDIVALLEESMQATGRYYSDRTQQALHKRLAAVLDELEAEGLREAKQLTAFIVARSKA